MGRTHVTGPRRTVFQDDSPSDESPSGDVVSDEVGLAIHELSAVYVAIETTVVQCEASAAGRPPVPITPLSRPLLRPADGVTGLLDHRHGLLLNVPVPEHDVLPVPSVPTMFAVLRAVWTNGSIDNEHLVRKFIPVRKTMYTGKDQTGLNKDVYFDVIATMNNSFCAVYWETTEARQVIQALIRLRQIPRFRRRAPCLNVCIVEIRIGSIFRPIFSCFLGFRPVVFPRRCVLNVVSALLHTFRSSPTFDALYLISG